LGGRSEVSFAHARFKTPDELLEVKTEADWRYECGSHQYVDGT
jgi:hypothetical protein